MRKSVIITNAASSVLQILVSSVTLVILYRVLIDAIGVERLGVWSLVIATTSMAQLASMGITGSIVKFVAAHDASGDHASLSLLIQTAIASIAALFVVVLLAAYPLAGLYLGYALKGSLLDAALAILPQALAAYWIAMLTGVVQAGLYGCQLIACRNNLLMAESVSYLALCFFVAGRYGLAGLAWARVAQNLVSLLASWCLLKRRVPALPLLPRRFDRNIFREIVGYSANFQAISALAMLCDPLTKGLIGNFGSAATVGYYEMANRLVQQVRSVIVSANQVLVPAFAQLKELEPGRIRGLYLRSYRLLFFISAPVFSALIVGAPLVSRIWIGRYEGAFVTAAVILGIGWFFNTLCVPAYYAGLGTGELRWNLVSHAVMAFLNVGLGYLLGTYLGGVGVMAGWAVALATGGVMLGISFHRTNGLPVGELLPASSRWLAVSCLTGIVPGYLLIERAARGESPLLYTAATLAGLASLLAGPLWMHPVRREITEWIGGMRRKQMVVTNESGTAGR